MSVVIRIRGDQLLCVVTLAGKEHLIPGHKNLIEMTNRHTLTVLGTEGGFGLARATRRSRDNGEPFGVNGQSATHSKVCILFAHGATRHDQQLVHVRAARNDRLHTRNHNAVGVTLGNVDIGIDHCLVSRALAAIPFAIRHRHAQREIFVLNTMQVREKALMLLAAGLLCHLPGCLINGIQGIVGQIALRATAFATQESHCLEFGEQIL